jgi:uncharacterized membrane protein
MRTKSAHAPKPDHAHWRGGTATDRLFIITVLVKGIDGALGVIGGAVLAVIKPSTIDHIVVVLTTHELSRNPDDYVANLLVHWAEHIDLGKLAFAAGYLIAHGALKTFLAVTLLLGRPWSYPVGSTFLALFMAYTAYRLTLHWSWPLVAFFCFDLFTLIMVLREWRSQRRHGYEPM